MLLSSQGQTDHDMQTGIIIIKLKPQNAFESIGFPVLMTPW